MRAGRAGATDKAAPDTALGRVARADLRGRRDVGGVLLVAIVLVSSVSVIGRGLSQLFAA